MNFSRLYGAVIANTLSPFPGMLPDPVFYGISAVHGKVPGAPTLGFFKTFSPHQLMG